MDDIGVDAGLALLKEILRLRAEATGRTGGRLRGQIAASEDFDELPKDIAEAFGAEVGGEKES